MVPLQRKLNSLEGGEGALVGWRPMGPRRKDTLPRPVRGMKGASITRAAISGTQEVSCPTALGYLEIPPRLPLQSPWW